MILTNVNVKRIIIVLLIHHGNVSRVIVIDWEQIHQTVHRIRVPVNAGQVYLVVNAINALIRKDYISLQISFILYIVTLRTVFFVRKKLLALF